MKTKTVLSFAIAIIIFTVAIIQFNNNDLKAETEGGDLNLVVVLNGGTPYIPFNVVAIEQSTFRHYQVAMIIPGTNPPTAGTKLPVGIYNIYACSNGSSGSHGALLQRVRIASDTQMPIPMTVTGGCPSYTEQ